jgi:fructokinase
MSDSRLYGAIEAGGNKFICAVGSGPHDVRDRVRIPTTTPADTLAKVVDFFQPHHRKTPLAAMGIGSFGPVDLRLDSPTYGRITSTPKPGWRDTDVVGPIHEAVGSPIAFDTDVNASALGEHRWGAGTGLHSLVYVTVGTGIGGGAIVDGRPLHGESHPEMGHIRVPHDREIDPFEGCCPYHGDCLEGLASGPAIEARWGQPAQMLTSEHPAWALEAEYLAIAMANIAITLSPQRIVMGGGVMNQRHLFPMIRTRLVETLNGYGLPQEVVDGMDEYIVPPALGDDSGIAGAFAMAHGILDDHKETT